MRSISLHINGKENAELFEDGNWKIYIPMHKNVSTTYADLLDASFTRTPAKTFDERYELVVKNQYFCIIKPSLMLIAKDYDQEGLSDIEEKVISLYKQGLTPEQISDQIEQIYGFGCDEVLISELTKDL